MSNRPARLTDVAPFTMGTIVICVAVFVVMLTKFPPGTAGSFLNIPREVLETHGGSWRKGVWDGEWFRFLTPLFLHVNAIHILLNMYMLYRLGPGAEIHFGTRRFAAIYLLSGLGGVCLSLLFGGYLSAGASGSLFGIMGAYLSAKVMAHYDWRRAMKSSEVRQTALYILLNFAFCLAIPNIDHWGHAGGLLLGFLYGALFEYQRNHRRLGLTYLAVCLFVTAGLVASCRWMVFHPHYHVYLGLKADAEGRTQEADARFAAAKRRAQTFPPTMAAQEVQRRIRELARNVPSKRGPDLSPEERLIGRYLQLLFDLEPHGAWRAWLLPHDTPSEEP